MYFFLLLTHSPPPRLSVKAPLCLCPLPCARVVHPAWPVSFSTCPVYLVFIPCEQLGSQGGPPCPQAMRTEVLLLLLWVVFYQCWRSAPIIAAALSCSFPLLLFQSTTATTTFSFWYMLCSVMQNCFTHLENKLLLDLPTHSGFAGHALPVSHCTWTECNICCSACKNTWCFLITSGCIQLGLQPGQQMLPALWPYPFFMSSCPLSHCSAAILWLSGSYVVSMAGWLCSPTSTLFGLELAEAVCCQEQCEPTSRSWELLELRSPGLWKGLSVT